MQIRIISSALAVAGLLWLIGSCTAVEHLPELEPGDFARVELFGYGASIEKLGEDTVATVDPDVPSVIHVELVTLDGEIFTGDLTPGTQIVLPPGSLTMTVSDTKHTPTNKLESTGAPKGSGSGGGTMMDLVASTQGWGQLERPTAPYHVALFSVDSFKPLDDWDVQGSFTLLAADEHAAHQLIHAWAATHGQDYVINGLIQEVHQAFTTRFVFNQGKVEFLVTAMNDQPALVSGDFVYQNGTKVPMAWAPMDHRGAPLWKSVSVLDGGLFPVDSAGLLQSFEVRLQTYNKPDGLLATSFGVDHQGVPVL